MTDKKTLKSGDTVRVTGVISIGERTYQPNTLVKNLPEADLNTNLKAGRISADEKGIKYCQEELKAKVVDHKAKAQAE
ncbi:MAG: hypothetical protein RPR40_10075 [Bermanella sp.]